MVGRQNHLQLVARLEGSSAARQHQQNETGRLRRVEEAALASERLPQLHRTCEPR
jgi:hypothetical protein